MHWLTPVAFGDALAALRRKYSLNQNQLAHACGYDHSYISRLELGKRQPSRETVLALAGVLDVTAIERGRLLRAAGYWPEDSNIALIIAREEMDRVGRAS